MPNAAKPCAFHCGQSSCDPDPIDDTQRLRWAYKDGSGNSCHYCERIWQVKEAHKHPSRSEYQAACRTNKTTLDNHMELRDKYITDMKTGGRARMSYKKTGGVKKVNVKTLAARKRFVCCVCDWRSLRLYCGCVYASIVFVHQSLRLYRIWAH